MRFCVLLCSIMQAEYVHSHLICLAVALPWLWLRHACRSWHFPCLSVTNMLLSQYVISHVKNICGRYFKVNQDIHTLTRTTHRSTIPVAASVAIQPGI